jgi:hypothetical protein
MRDVLFDGIANVDWALICGLSEPDVLLYDMIMCEFLSRSARHAAVLTMTDLLSVKDYDF